MNSKSVNRTKEERVVIVLDLIKKLKKFPRGDFFTTNNLDNLYINLYNEEYPAIKELKKGFDEYINNEYSVSGKIKFQEINRKIEYVLPIKKTIQPIFVLKHIQ